LPMSIENSDIVRHADTIMWFTQYLVDSRRSKLRRSVHIRGRAAGSNSLFIGSNALFLYTSQHIVPTNQACFHLAHLNLRLSRFWLPATVLNIRG
jgi:hypothetical protein